MKESQISGTKWKGSLKIFLLKSIVENLLQLINSSHVFQNIEELIKLLPNYNIQIDNGDEIPLKFQADFFHYKTGSFIASIPNEYDSTMRQIYLVTDQVSSEHQVLYFIPRLNPFFREFGTYCFYCKKFFTSKGCIHKCAHTRNCFACHRPFLEQNTFTTYETQNNFCDGLLTESPMLICNTCNVNYYSSNCFDIHSKKVCQRGWKCKKCNIYQSCNTFFKSPAQIKKKHLCHHRTCNFCGKWKEKRHFCTLKKVQEKSEFTNLAFVSFEYSGYNVGKCLACFKKSDNLPCQNCLSQNETPVCCAILQEEADRKSFSFKCLFNNELTKAIVSKNNLALLDKCSLFNFDYIPNFVLVNPTLAPEGRKTNFGQRSKNQKYLKAFLRENMTFMQVFFDYLLKNKFTNSTILVYSGTNKDMFYILQGLLDNGFLPKVIKCHNQIMLVEEKKLGLRFVEIQNYVNCSFKEMCLRIRKIEPHFPFQWIQPKYFLYEGDWPTITDFFYFEDSKEDRKLKEEAINKSKNQMQKWKFQDVLFHFLQQKIEIISLVMLDFLKEAFYSQKVLFEAFNSTVKSYLHPLQSPIFTAATYSFQLFLKFSPDSEHILPICTPIFFKSSKGEIEYIKYLEWKNPDQKFEHAWSPNGQKNLKFSSPDAFSEDHLWYYHGCFFHSHNRSKCLFKRKKPLETEKKEKEFFEKIRLMKKTYDIKKVTIMWECTWRFLKETDKDVQYFLTNVYRNPPMYRLNPRDAGKSTLKRAKNSYSRTGFF